MVIVSARVSRAYVDITQYTYRYRYTNTMHSLRCSWLCISDFGSHGWSRADACEPTGSAEAEHAAIALQARTTNIAGRAEYRAKSIAQSIIHALDEVVCKYCFVI